MYFLPKFKLSEFVHIAESVYMYIYHIIRKFSTSTEMLEKGKIYIFNKIESNQIVIIVSNGLISNQNISNWKKRQFCSQKKWG